MTLDISRIMDDWLDVLVVHVSVNFFLTQVRLWFIFTVMDLSRDILYGLIMEKFRIRWMLYNSMLVEVYNKIAPHG